MPRRSANGTAPALGTIGATLALVDALLGREAALVRARHRAVTLLLNVGTKAALAAGGAALGANT